LKSKTPTVQLDYSYLKQGPDEKLIKVKTTDVTKKEAETLITALTAIDTLTGLMLHCPIPKKGAHKYSEQEQCKFLMETGRGNAQPHSDNEPALLALIKSVIAKMGTGLSYRTGPTYSPQSQGDIERAHGTLLAQLRTMIDDFCKRYKLKKLEIIHPLFHWLVLHCNFLLNRYLV
jgi:hypothetical protein